MNFLKGSLFRRNTEPEELEPMEESGGGILAVWGSPGCGKTVTAVKIAKNLAAQKKNTVLLLCDMTAPMMPCICPPSELEVDRSLGSIFAAQHISVNLIKHNLSTLKRLPHLTMLGLRKKENEYTYAPCTKQQAEELIRGLREIVPYRRCVRSAGINAWTGEHRQRISEDLKRKCGIYHLWPERGAEQQRPQFRPKQGLYRRSGDPLGGTGAIPWEPFARS